MSRRLLALTGATCLLGGTLNALVPPAVADHGDFTLTNGIYRIPYADGTDMNVNQDHHTHGGPDGNKNRFDLEAGVGTPIVPGASGWIRAIVDFNGNSPGAGDGVDINGDPQDDTLEHSCGNNPDDNTVVGSCSDYNNYVWIEHPNGEWSKYTHMGTGTVTALGWQVDDWIEAGETLGTENDIGQATGGPPANHLHWEVAIPNDPDDDLTWDTLGGFFNNGQNIVPVICDIGDNGIFDQGESFTAAPCDHAAPTADAGGPYVVDEGSSVQLDGTGSDDPEGLPLTYAWSPADLVDDADLAMPTYAALDDTVDDLTLTVYDTIEALDDSDSTTVTVQNVAPTVTAVGDTIDEAGTATVSAEFTDPGTADTHGATVDWGDGTDPEIVGLLSLEFGVDHVYGDNGTYAVTVTVTDDDGGIGTDEVDVVVGNLNPTATVDTDDEVSFPGGDYLVVDSGGELPIAADGTDPGSDDLTFAWNDGDAATYFNDGVGPDPLPSPFGTFPFAASDTGTATWALPGLETLGLSLTDDDGGYDSDSASVLVTGVAETSEGDGWWKHQYTGTGSPQLPDDLLGGYLEVVNAASSVFSEQTQALTFAQAAEILAPKKGNARAKARSALLTGWLQFASGAVAWDETVTLSDESTISFLDLMFEAEAIILDGSASNAELNAVTLDLNRIRHAE